MEATRLAEIVSVRGDVRDFIEAAEKLLFPALPNSMIKPAQGCSPAYYSDGSSWRSDDRILSKLPGLHG